MIFKTEEEKKEYNHQRYLKNKEKWLSRQKDYYNNNKKTYKEYYENNKEKIIERQKEYNNEHYQENKEKIAEYHKIYRHTPMGRATSLLGAYNRSDKKANRGKGDLTAQWIVENIFSQPCAHCGKEGWDVIGCNRLDNSKPHTKDNVEPCCLDCNVDLAALYNKKEGAS